MPRRFAMARLFQETNALSPVPTEAADFERFAHRGKALLERCRRGIEEIPGIWRHAELTGFTQRLRRESDVEVVPLVSAFAIPGGKVPRPVFEAYVQELIDAWRAAGPCDGLYLVLHGAMGVDGLDDAEGRLLELVRQAVGRVPVVVSFDLHGFLTPTRLACIDGLVVYRTFPHRDHRQTGVRAAELLLRQGSEATPTHAWRSLPMILGGYPSVDFVPPMSGLFRALRRLERRPEVWSANLLTCQPWHDAPALGWAVHVTTDGDAALAEALVEELAETAWAARHRQPPPVDEGAVAVAKVRRARWRSAFGTLCLSDTSDAVGAGGVGENTALLRALLDHGPGLRAVVPLRDAEAVERLSSEPVGARVALEVGGRLAPDWYDPLPVEVTVRSHHEHTLLGGRSVVVQVGRAKVVLTADAPIALSPQFFRDVGLRPVQHDVCVVKSWMAFQFFFLTQSRGAFWAETRGVTDLAALRTLSFDVPVHPLVVVDDWREADARRRAV